jgi:catechol 2,3-dioxygenase-like lactoylglutathione lyase family enzyme
MSHLPVGPVHHIRMTVTDVERSTAFYTEILGFAVAVAGPPPPDDETHDVLVDSLQDGVILAHQGMFFGLRPCDDARVSASDRFDAYRVGLDHLSFAVPARADLDRAVELLDERGVEHGPIRELAPLGLAFLAFFDPDGIALELSAPIAD